MSTAGPMSDPQEGAEPEIKLHGIWKTFGDTAVLRGVDLIVGQGQVVAIIGSSGGGKTTLLRCINLLEIPDEGNICIRNEPVYDSTSRKPILLELSSLRRLVGMVFQQFHLFPHLTAVENITLPLQRILKMDQREAVDTAMTALARVGVAHKALSSPDRMSGGEQQRTAIARALAMRPLGLLFDEPTSALDPESRAEVNSVIRELADSGLTMVVVTHDLQFAEKVADEIVFIDRGEVAEAGPPSRLLRDPVEARTAAFVRSHRDVL